MMIVAPPELESHGLVPVTESATLSAAGDPSASGSQRQCRKLLECSRDQRGRISTRGQGKRKAVASEPTDVLKGGSYAIS